MLGASGAPIQRGSARFRTPPLGRPWAGVAFFDDGSRRPERRLSMRALHGRRSHGSVAGCARRPWPRTAHRPSAEGRRFFVGLGALTHVCSIERREALGRRHRFTRGRGFVRLRLPRRVAHRPKNLSLQALEDLVVDVDRIEVALDRPAVKVCRGHASRPVLIVAATLRTSCALPYPPSSGTSLAAAPHAGTTISSNRRSIPISVSFPSQRIPA